MASVGCAFGQQAYAISDVGSQLPLRYNGAAWTAHPQVTREPIMIEGGLSMKVNGALKVYAPCKRYTGGAAPARVQLRML